MSQQEQNPSETTTAKFPYKDSPSGLTFVVAAIVVFGSWLGGEFAWPLLAAPHARIDGALGGVILACIGVSVLLYARAVRRRRNKAVATFRGVSLSIVAIIIAWAGAMKGRLYACSAHGFSEAATLRAAFKVISEHLTQRDNIDGSIALFLSQRTFIGDWYSDSMARCACRERTPPMIGSIDLRDIYSGNATFDEAQAEFERSGAADAPWERLGDMIFSRDPRAWTFDSKIVVSIVLNMGCDPCMKFQMQFCDGRVEWMHACEDHSRSLLLEACVNARQRGIPLLPPDILEAFKITEADIDAAVSARQSTPTNTP